MFALVTIYWISSVISTIQLVNLLNISVTACHGSDDAPICIHDKAQAIGIQPLVGLAMFASIFFINVSNAPRRVVASELHIIRKHPP
jgi:hypothetical protein